MNSLMWTPRWNEVWSDTQFKIGVSSNDQVSSKILNRAHYMIWEIVQDKIDNRVWESVYGRMREIASL